MGVPDKAQGSVVNGLDEGALIEQVAACPITKMVCPPLLGVTVDGCRTLNISLKGEEKRLFE